MSCFDGDCAHSNVVLYSFVHFCCFSVSNYVSAGLFEARKCDHEHRSEEHVPIFATTTAVSTVFVFRARHGGTGMLVALLQLIPKTNFSAANLSSSQHISIFIRS